MAFPLDQSHLLRHLRTSFVSLSNDPEYSSKIIKSYGDNNTSETISGSPPISFQIARHLKDRMEKMPGFSTKTKKRNSSSRKKKMKIQDENMEKIQDQISDYSSDDEANYTGTMLHPIDDDAVEETVSVKSKKRKSRNPLVSFFQSKESDDSSDDSDRPRIYEEQKQQRENYISSDDEDDGDTTEKQEEDSVTIDSDFGVPVNAQGNVVHNYQGISDEEEEVGDDEEDEYDDDLTNNLEEDDDFDSDYDFESDDSAFTELDNSSISLLESYQDGNQSISFNPQSSSTDGRGQPGSTGTGGIDGKRKKSKKPGDSLEQHTIPRTVIGSLKLTPAKSTITLKKQHQSSLQFDKVNPDTVHPPTHSNLSSLVQSKHKSANVNPLQYFSFANGESSDSSTTYLNIFVPPNTTPSLSKLPIVTSISIFDTIGYILLQLYNLPGGQLNLNLNPNAWRLELVDEDGENYGSFGVLDRTRLLSSYNVSDLAIVKCEAEEHDNSKVSPLPREFEVALGAFQRKRSSIAQILTTTDIEPLEFEIMINEPNIQETTNVKVPGDYTMGQVLKQVCSTYGLAPSKYKFKCQQQDVRNNDYAVHATSNILQLVPIVVGLMPSISAFDDTAGITPSSISMITPADNPFEEKMNDLTLKDQVSSNKRAMTTKNTTTENRKSNPMQAKYLDDILQGNNPQLPPSINTIYFKWKVVKNNSKMKIKNFSEKNFIIDGDYIHLTPPDDIDLTNIEDNPTTQHHHYNYLTHHGSKASSKTYSFHITQISKTKQYAKPANYFRLIVNQQGKDGSPKKFYLVARTEIECHEILDKLKWVLQVYNLSNV
ncbi:hypothetical protein JA1_001618 [Spathaspora sp. JA1]|nr:hypothetical protein JA1_001618 [Spathaspora sp. JA1]